MTSLQATTDGWNGYGYWQCHHCGGNHSWTKGCPDIKPTVPWQSPPVPSVGTKPARKAPKHVTDVVRGTEVTGRCNLCKKAFKKSDAIIQISDVANFADDPCLIHRRCMEDLLSSSIDDAPKEKQKFEEYRREIADKYGIEDE